MAARTGALPGPLARFVGVAFEGRTYRHLVYLALAFPLGIAYFVTFTVLFSVGASLAIFLVGIPILLSAVGVGLVLVAVERRLATVLLDLEFEEPVFPSFDDPVTAAREVLLDRTTWLGIVYLLSKFVVGVVAFVLLVCFASFSLAFVLAPLYYRSGTIGIHVPETVHLSPGVALGWGDLSVELVMPITITSWLVQTIWEALLLSAVGVLILLASLHAVNGIARGLGWYTRVMLR